MFYIGDKKVKVKDNDIEVLDITGVVDETYIGTPGLWEFLTSKNPNKNIYTDEDKETYKNLLIKTNSIYRDNEPNSNNPAGNRKCAKWKKMIKPIWGDTIEEKKRKKREKKKTKEDQEEKELELLLFRVILTRC